MTDTEKIELLYNKGSAPSITATGLVVLWALKIQPIENIIFKYSAFFFGEWLNYFYSANEL